MVFNYNQYINKNVDYKKKRVFTHVFFNIRNPFIYKIIVLSVKRKSVFSYELFHLELNGILKLQPFKILGCPIQSGLFEPFDLHHSKLLNT